MLLAPLVLLSIERGTRGKTMKFGTHGLEDFVTDRDAERDGIKIKISDTVSFRCRRAGGGNALYDRALAKHSRPFIRRIRNSSMSNEELKQKVVLPTYLDAVILGWEGVTDENGSPVAYSKQACEQFFEALPNVFDELVAVCSDLAAFRREELQEVADAAGES